MPALICDLSGLVSDVDHDDVMGRLRTANGGTLAVTDLADLRDGQFDAFAAGELGEGEFARHLRVKLGWQGSDVDLAQIVGGLHASVDIAVMELLLDLREDGWYLLGVDHQAGASAQSASGWGGHYAEQLAVFDRVLSTREVGAALGTSAPLPTTDPRFFMRLRHETPAAHGNRTLVSADPLVASAARTHGFESHVYRGATALRSACMLSV